MANIGLISSIPSVCSFAGLILSSFVADYLRSGEILSIKNVSTSLMIFGNFGRTPVQDLVLWQQ